ncbi:MAG: YgjV family protein [Clostridiales bacterium]|nr:YgjV family protein [Clostridiales bacterium]
MLDIIIGNACSLCATVTDAISASRKTARGVLMVQVLSQLFYGIGAIVLKGYSAAVQNGVSILRNLLAAGEKTGRLIEWTLVALAMVLGLYFNNMGIVGLLPIIANLQYSLAVFRFRNDERKLKFSLLIAVFLFTIFNAFIWNVAGAVSNFVLFLMTLLFLIQDRKAAGKKPSDE